MSGHVADRLSAYMDGELSVVETAQVKGHLEACSECALHLEELTAVDAGARELAVAAPEGYFDRLPARVRERLTRERRPARPPVWAWAAAAGFLIAVLTPLLLRERPALEPARSGPPPSAFLSKPEAPPAAEAPRPSEETKEPFAREPERSRLSSQTRKVAPPQARTKGREALEERDAVSGRADNEKTAQEPEETIAEDPPTVPLSPSSAPATEARRAKPDPAAELDKAQADRAAAPATPAAGQPPGPPPPSGRGATTASSASADQKEERGERTLEARVEPQTTDEVTEGKRVDEDALFEALQGRRPGSAREARTLRELWREFSRGHPGGARGDEARVRVIEVGATAYRLGRNPRDLTVLQEDATAYLRRKDAAQRDRVRAVLSSLAP